MQEDIKKLPVHIGMIMDGNRRYARALMKEPWHGHELGVKQLENVLNWCKEFGIRYVTLYALSLENLASRPKNELDFILKLIDKELDKILSGNHKAHENKVRIRFLGKLDELDKYKPGLTDKMKRIEELTSQYSNYFLNLAIAYTGRQEIVDACNKAAADAAKGKALTQESFKKYLYTNDMPDPDLVIRTAGEHRISGFLLYQGAYSEFVFIDKPWPAMERDDFVQALEEYSRRNRTFGGG